MKEFDLEDIPVAMRFLDTAPRRLTLARRLLGEMLGWGLAAEGFAGGLFGTSHGFENKDL